MLDHAGIRPLHLLRGALAMLLIAGLPAMAQDDDNDDKKKDKVKADKTELVRVEDSVEYIPSSNSIATRLPVDLMDTPANVGTVNAAVISDQNAVFLGDALRNISGVNAQSESGVADFFMVRGMDSLSSGLVMIDGAAEPEVSFFHMYNVERVEVLKGPGGFLYGRTGLTGALGGVVNIVRRQPMPANFTRAGFSGGSFGTVQGNIDWNTSNKDGDFGFRLNAMYRESDSYRDEKPNDSWAINPAFTYWFSPDTALNVNVEYMESSFSPDGGIPLYNNAMPDVDPKTNYQSPFDFSDQKLTRIQVDFDTQLSDSWRLRNKTFYRKQDWQSQGTLSGGVIDDFMGFPIPPEVIRFLTVLDDKQEYVGNQVEGIWTTTAGQTEHSILVGFEAGIYSDDFSVILGCDPGLLAFGACLLPTVSLLDPVESATDFVLDPLGPQDEGNGETVVTAPYAMYQGKLTSWFQVLAGVRLDRIDFEDTLSGEKFDDTDVSPSLGVVFQPSESVSIYASANESFAPPSVRVVDPTPEEARQLELGVKQSYQDGKLLVNLAAYRLQRENIPITGNNAVTQQAGDQESTGFEVEIAAEPVPGLRTFFSYAYTDAELTSFVECLGFVSGGVCFPIAPGPLTADHSGNTPAFVPEHMASIWVTQRYNSGFGWGAGARYLSEQFISEDNAFAIDAYTLMDAALYYRIGRWDLQINVKNLTDETYETRGFRSFSVLPGNGRAIYGGFEVQF